MKKILIAEDDKISRNLLKAILSKSGYQTVEVSDGKKALVTLLSQNAPQMVLLDWMMPEIDGLALCKILKENQRLDPLYLVLITSRARREDIVQGLNAGADDYIIKPFDKQELIARISAGFRSLELQMQLKDYSQNMEKLANERAAQLVHQDRMATLGLMSASITHEINNPATFVSINAQILEDNWNVIKACIAGEATEDEQRRAQLISGEIPSIFTEIRSGISRIKHIVENLKTYSRSGNNNFQETDIAFCLEEALKICWNKLKHTVTVTRNYDPDLPGVMADCRRLEQVFINLFINAADAMEMAGVHDGQLIITTEKVHHSVIIKIQDTGPGIPRSHLDSIFSPFFTTKKTGKGTGLGLLISRGIITDHNGTMTASNRDHGGAEFCIALPPIPVLSTQPISSDKEATYDNPHSDRG